MVWGKRQPRRADNRISGWGHSIGARAAVLGLAATIVAMLGARQTLAGENYLPSGAATKVVSVSPQSAAKAHIVVLTVPLPSANPDAKEIAAFGELFAYSPRTIFVRRDQPTLFSFWNLQPNEEHDFMLVAPDGRVLAHMELPQLKKTDITLEFHQAGLFTFYCTMHQPYMTGQIFVLNGPSDRTTALAASQKGASTMPAPSH